MRNRTKAHIWLKNAAFFVIIFGVLATSASAAISDDLIGCYDFETDGTDGVNSNDLTQFGAVGYNASGKIGYSAYNFSSANYFGSGSTTAAASADINRTLCYWGKPAGSYPGIVSGAFSLGNRAGNENPQFINYMLEGESVFNTNEGSADYKFNPLNLPQDGFSHLCFIWITNNNTALHYFNGSSQTKISGTNGNAAAPANTSITIGRALTAAGYYWRGEIDALQFWDRALSTAEIEDVFNSGDGRACSYFAPAGGTPPYAHLSVKDLYDNSSVADGTPCFMGEASNTSTGGTCYFYNQTTGLNYSVGGTNYFVKTGTATENATTSVYLSGALVSFNVTDLLFNTIYNYTANDGTQKNESLNGAITLLLSPNSAHNITIQAFDGNGTGGLNSTNQTYINQTYSITTGPKDQGVYNLTGLYQTILRINVTKGLTNNEVTNYTANITSITPGNWLNYTNVTTENNARFNLMWGNYSIVIDPVEYSISRQNTSIEAWNYSGYARVPVYALNSFYLTFLDEVTRSLITQNVTLELISDATSGTYSTTNGSLSLEILTPAEYTLRYKTTPFGNYTERDYYQTLVNNNYYDINLYGLSSGDATDLVFHVEDNGGRNIENATIKFLRYYTYCNCYEIVEMAKTSYTGDAYFIADYYDGHYKYAVEYLGTTRFLSTSPENFVLPATGFVTKTIILNLAGDYYESYRGLTNVAAITTFNQTTKALTFTWNDPGGLVTRGCLNVDYRDNMELKTFSHTCVNGSAGSTYAVLSNYGNITYKYSSKLYTSTTYSDYTIDTGWFDKDAIYNFGVFGAFLGLIVLVLLSLLFSFSAIAVLAINVVGVAALSLLAIAPFTTTFIMGLGTLVFGISVYLFRSR